ncbi:MAG: hypothetical protein M3O68_00100, partial [Thermoproteota archaeon]|nr:hypothetical protein [Thermoproteota archaeon]
SHLNVDHEGSFVGAVHGYFIFIKPLPVGEHTLHYDNDVRSQNPKNLEEKIVNHADITYSFKVK